MMATFLFKTEPDEYSLDDLESDGTAPWDGIRNYGARNRLQKCEEGDLVLIYHSGRNASVVGTARVASAPYPDPAQFDPSSDYYDAKATEEEPRWWCVDITFESRFDEAVSLAEMKVSEALSDMEVLRQQRLSVSVVSDDERDWICRRAQS